jgi:hypothetical protein
LASQLANVMCMIFALPSAHNEWNDAMWMHLLTTFVELVKATATPIAAVIVALSYKPVLLSILTRSKLELEGFGVKAKIDQIEQQQVAAVNPATEKLPEARTLDPSPRPVVNIMETRIRADLSKIDGEKREPILVRALAQSRLEAGHEFTYIRIFGSQIAALKRLNEVGRATVDNAREFFKPYAEKFPQIYSNYGFEGWLGFLRNSEMIKQDGNDLEISDFGRDFLMYLTERRLTENKLW